MTWRRLIAARIVREWKPKLEEVFREAAQFGVAVAGGVERVAMEAQLVHQTGHWVVQTDCSNAFNTAKRTAIHTGSGGEKHPRSRRIHRKVLR